MRARPAALAASTALLVGCSGVLDLRAPRSDPDAGAGGAAGHAVTGTPSDGGYCEPCNATCTIPPDNNPNLVAGLENGCGDVAERRNGRDTSWFTFSNPASIVLPSQLTALTPTCLGANGSCHSACMNGFLAGDSYPFAGLGVLFRNRNPAVAYDLSAYRAVSFYVLGTVAEGSRLRFTVPQVADTPVGVGGTCTTMCGDAYQVDVPGFTPGVPHSQWQKVTIALGDLSQIGYAAQEPWNPATALSLQWTVYSPLEVVTGDVEFEICVDQVELVPR